MYYSEYKDYIEQFKPGIKKISRRTKQLRITKELSLELRNFPKNYDLYFNRNGRLTCINHFIYRENKLVQIDRHECTYFKDGPLALLLIYDLVSHELKKKVEFEYDEEGRILGEYETQFGAHDGDEGEIHYLHTYSKNFHRMDCKDWIHEENYYLETWFDEEGRTMEEKAGSDENGLLYWTQNIFDADGILYKELDLNEDGTTNSETLFISENNSSCKTIFANVNMEWEYVKEINEKGEWVCENAFRNGELKWMRERKIGYYEL